MDSIALSHTSEHLEGSDIHTCTNTTYASVSVCLQALFVLKTYIPKDLGDHESVHINELVMVSMSLISALVVEFNSSLTELVMKIDSQYL